jgi:septal ring factor EnvC (AmiA/AmiB activator)
LATLREEIEEAEEGIREQREKLDTLKTALENASAASDAARKQQSKATRVLDDLQKEINEWASLFCFQASSQNP